MQHNYAFPIGSNTKLFTAVALWQLHRQGKVNMFDPVTEYLDPADFGLKERWCPRLSNVTSGPCLRVELQHLLRMSSGLYDTDNCDYAPGSPQLHYCRITGPEAAKWTLGDIQNLQASCSGNRSS
eukprot:jgi/Chrzof1/9010/Cz03g32230.t1